MPYLIVYDGKRTFSLEMDLCCSTIADLFDEVGLCYGLQLDSRKHLRIIFADKELRFSRKKHPSDYGIINRSTVGVIFRLPDSAPAAATASVAAAMPVVALRKPHSIPDPDTAGKVEKDESRPKLRRLPGKIELTNLGEDSLALDDEHSSSLFRAVMPCGHVIDSKSMRLYVESELGRGAVKILCTDCPAVWDYPLVRHVASFTDDELQSAEKTMATNFFGKDSTSLTCPECFTWSCPLDPTFSRLRCFLCMKTIGREFIFCKNCLGEWKSSDGVSCGNPGCSSINEARLEILRNSPVTQRFGGVWPTIRACPRCGFVTQYMGRCSQMHCPSCGHYYCFLCLKGAKSKAQLTCIPYNSDCQRAPLQVKIPHWDGNVSD